MEDFFDSTPNWYRDFLYVYSSPESSVQLGGCWPESDSLTLLSYLPLDSVTDSVIDSVIDLVDSVNDTVTVLVYYPFLMYVYIEALVPYRIDRVLILDRPVQQDLFWPGC